MTQNGAATVDLGIPGIKAYVLPDHTYPLVIEPTDPQASSYDQLHKMLEDNKPIISRQISTYTAVLLRRFNVPDQEHFRNIVRIFAPNLVDYVGGDSPRTKTGDNVYTSTEYPAQYPISLHNEMSFSKVYPRYICLYCDIPAETGGETPLIDCRKLLETLDPAVREKFETKGLKYVQNLADEFGIGKSWQETFFTEDKEAIENHLRKLGADFEWQEDGALRVIETVDAVVAHPETGEKVFFSQADQWHPSNLDEETRNSMMEMVDEEDLYHNCYYGDGSMIDEADLNHIREVVERDKVMFPWQKHDVALVDNILAMHGRSPFTGERRILVALGNP